MKIVHNSINKPDTVIKKPKQKASTWAQRQNYKQYQKALKKYATEIAQIQQHIPGWMPKFNY